MELASQVPFIFSDWLKLCTGVLQFTPMIGNYEDVTTSIMFWLDTCTYERSVHHMVVTGATGAVS